MIKRILAFGIALCLCLPLLFACGGGNNNDVQNGNYTIVYGTDELSKNIASEIRDAFSKDLNVGFSPSSEEKKNLEIVVGSTNREISSKAYKNLERIDTNSDTELRYLIYSDGKSVAIAYDVDIFETNAAAMTALEIFLKEYVTGKTSISFKSGTLHSGTIDFIQYQAAVDEVLREEEWAKLYRAIPTEYADEMINAFRALYSIYSTDVATWFANLYEPSICICNGECQNTKYCGTGAFYYSNSARDTIGYLPDVESTRQALNFITGSGLAKAMGGESYVDFLPEKMADAIVAFVRSLQEENGYFYHPQWGIEQTDSQISRRGRDLNWATKILEDFNVAPKYDTPNGMKGENVAPSASENELTARLHENSVSAVSKIISVASSSRVASHLKDEASFRAYLNSLPIETESYEVGNELAAQSSQILARDKELAASNAGYSLAEIAIEWLNSKQNPETGTWDQMYDYHATNGLMKISCFYNDMGAYLPNAERAVASALYSMTTDEDPYNICCIYNNWFTINNVIENIKVHGGTSAQNEVAKIRELLYAQGAESIIASAQKLALFSKTDGSFSYQQEHSSYTSQGMPVCVPYTNEGDVNATDIGIEGTLNNLFKSFGLSSAKVSILGKADAIKYLMIIDELQPVIKDDITVNVDYITFDDDSVGSVPGEVTNGLKSTLASLGVVKDNRGSGNVLRFNSPADSGKSNSITFTCSTASQKCYTFESDICIESADEGYIIQLSMGRCYMLAFRIVDGKLNLWDSSNTSSTARIETELGIAPKIGEWFNLKIEYYVGDDDTVRIIAYYNGKATAVSDNYYDNSASKVDTGTGKPSQSYTGVTLSTISSRSSSILLDNVALYKSSKIYSMPTGNLYQNVDEVQLTDNIFSFDTAENSTDYPSGVTVNGALVSDFNGGKGLEFANVDDSAVFPISRKVIGARCNLYSLDVLINGNAKAGTYLDLKLLENNTNKKPVTAFRIEVCDGYAVIESAPDGSVIEVFDNAKIDLGKNVNLTFEYFERDHITLIYVNGKLCAASEELSAYGKQYIPGLFEITLGGNADTITVDNVKAEKNSRKVADALKPDGDSTVHDFNSPDSELVISGTAHIGNGAANIPSGGAIELPIKTIGVVTNSVMASFDLKAMTDGREGIWYVAFTDAGGTPIFAIGVKRQGGRISISEYSVSGTHNPIFVSASVGEAVYLEIKLYPTEGEAQIFVDEKCVAISSVFYNEGAISRNAEKFKVTAVSGDSTLTIDNVRAERIYSIYESHSEIYDNFEDNSTTLTFEDSMNHRIPSLVSSVYATSAKTRIEELMNGRVRSKVLTFGTAAGGNDVLRIGITERATSYNKVIFDADIYTNFISCTSGKPQYHIFFETASGIAYQFRIVLENDKITFRDHDNTTQGANVPSSVSANEWFNLRIELELGDSDEFKAYCYVNDKKLFESDHYYGKGAGSAVYTSVERVRFYTMSAMTADISFDNVKFVQKGEGTVPPSTDDDTDEIKAEILPVKGGASGIVVLMHDDGDLVSASLLDSIYRKYSIRGNVALIVDRVYDVSTSTADKTKVSSWQNLLDSGRWQITSHSKTHDWWGTDNSDGKITDEVVNSKAILRDLFKDQRVLTFAYPGFSAYESTYTEDQIYGIAKELVSEHYVSGRYFGDTGAFEMDDVAWEFVIAESIGQSYLNQTLSTIDDAANGKMAIIFMHQVCQDTSSVPNQTVTYSHMTEIAKRISEYVNDGSVWNAFYEDAVLYLREAESAKLVYDDSNGNISVTVTDDLPDNIYNYPLTVRVAVPEAYEAVKVTQGGVINYFACKEIDGTWVADIDVVPSGVAASVTEASLTDVPKDEGESEESNSAIVDFENSAIGSDVAISGDASVAVSGSTSSNYDKSVTTDPVNESNKVFGITANAITSNTHLYVDRSSDSNESGNYYIFTTKLYLDNSLNGSMLSAAPSFATLDFRVKGTTNIYYTVNLRRIKINRDTPDESRGLAITPKNDTSTYLNKNDIIAYDNWVDLTVELHLNDATKTASVKYYVGEKLIATESASYAATLVGEVPNRVDIKYISGTSSKTFVDNVSFVRSTTPFIGSAEEGDENEDTDNGNTTDEIPAPTPSDNSKYDVFDFENSETTSTKGGLTVSLSATTDPNFVATVEKISGNKVLKVTNTSTSNRHIRFDFDKTKGNTKGGYYTVKMKLYISSEGATKDANFMDMDFRTTSGELLYTARGFWNISSDGVVTVSFKSNSKTDSYGVFVSGIPTDKWIDFVMVSYCYKNENGENAVDSDVYVDGVRLGGHKGLTISGASTPITVEIDRFNMKTLKNISSKFYIDDLIFARTEQPLIEDKED